MEISPLFRRALPKNEDMFWIRHFSPLELTIVEYFDHIPFWLWFNMKITLSPSDFQGPVRKSHSPPLDLEGPTEANQKSQIRGDTVILVSYHTWDGTVRSTVLNA